MAKSKDAPVVSTKDLNRRLTQLKRWAAKAHDGSIKAKHLAASERWRTIKKKRLRLSCCGKAPSKRCKGCPAVQASMIMAPLSVEGGDIERTTISLPLTIDDLVAHPEGGAFAERFRSSDQVTHPRNRGQRAALTLIHFRLQANEFSAWHRVDSDELWLHAGGDGIELLLWNGRGVVNRQRLGAEGVQPQTWLAVPAGCWQAARPLGSSALLHCVVVPGFDFADFELLRNGPKTLLTKLRRADKAAIDFL